MMHCGNVPLIMQQNNFTWLNESRETPFSMRKSLVSFTTSVSPRANLTPRLCPESASRICLLSMPYLLDIALATASAPRNNEFQLCELK